MLKHNNSIFFFHFTDDSKQGGIERYGKILEKHCPAEKSSSHTINLSNPSQVFSCSGSDNNPDITLYQYSPNFHSEASLSLILSLAKTPAKKRILVIHDANNLKTSSVAFNELLKGLLARKSYPDILNYYFAIKKRNSHFKRLAKLGFRFVVFHESQIRNLPKAAKKNTSVIPHFVEPREYSFQSKESKLALGLQSKKILTILGFINPRKLNELVIRTLEHLPNDYLLILAGKPVESSTNYLNKLDNLSKDLDVKSRVIITGYLEAEDQARYIAATDIALCLFKKVSASGSLSTWISNQKQIIASDLPEFSEFKDYPSTITIVPNDSSPQRLAKIISDAVSKNRHHSSKDFETLSRDLSIESTWEKLIRS